MLNEQETILLIEIVSILIVVLTALSISLVFIDKNRKLKHSQEVLRSQLEIQEQSLETIYHEIHDNIAQMLSLAKWNLHAIGETLPELEIEKLTRSKEIVGKAITDLRNLSKTLHTGVILEYGLNEALRRELSSFDKSSQYQIRLSEKGEPVRLDEQKELILFSILQQHLNNNVPYSKPKNVNVELDYQPRHLSLAVSDDGLGFSQRNAAEGEDHIDEGIRNMRNRASLIGAAFQFTVLMGGGTRIFIDLPLK